MIAIVALMTPNAHDHEYDYDYDDDDDDNNNNNNDNQQFDDIFVDLNLILDDIDNLDRRGGDC